MPKSTLKERLHTTVSHESKSRARLLSNASIDIERLLSKGDLRPPLFDVSKIRCETVTVPMRDGRRLATDLYLPPCTPAPVITMRTPYGRAADGNVGAFLSFARRGYIVVAQDCRGTGDSEPDTWDYYVYESEDGFDLIEWISRQQWCNGFIGSCGGSYIGQTQWCMALHPKMSTIIPHVSGLGIAFNTAHLYMFLNAYARSVGKGVEKSPIPYHDLERQMLGITLSGGFYNDPLLPHPPQPLVARYPNLADMSPSDAQCWLWNHYCTLTSAQRAQFVKTALGIDTVTIVDIEALTNVFGHRISHDAHTIPHSNPAELCRMIRSPPLILTGWYDWAVNDAFATWSLIRREALPEVAVGARMIITPYAHNMPGYHEGVEDHPELMLRIPGLFGHAGLVMSWCAAVRNGETTDWPRVIFYLMGANEWRCAEDWPVAGAKTIAAYLGAESSLTWEPPLTHSQPDTYVYDPIEPTPTVGGSIVSFVYPPGSVDVSSVQRRSDVLVYTTPILKHDLDVVGPLRMILYASSTAVDTDFVVRLSDVFPDGRSIQLQSGILRARYHRADGEPELLKPGIIYRLEIDLWHTANRFKVGHCLRIDIASADFPRFDRNTNRGGEPAPPIAATQTIYHDREHPSHLLLPILEDHEKMDAKEGPGAGGYS